MVAELAEFGLTPRHPSPFAKGSKAPGNRPSPPADTTRAGALLHAANADTELTREHDPVGRVVSETVNGRIRPARRGDVDS
ncbi:hypothetical protein GCM10010381_27080 [Streptomyces xantholiticus]|nr:hypothetical protein GCM10010381_27080 [Streptomyces xantholiticus]